MNRGVAGFKTQRKGGLGPSNSVANRINCFPSSWLVPKRKLKRRKQRGVQGKKGKLGLWLPFFQLVGRLERRYLARSESLAASSSSEVVVRVRARVHELQLKSAGRKKSEV